MRKGKEMIFAVSTSSLVIRANGSQKIRKAVSSKKGEILFSLGPNLFTLRSEIFSWRSVFNAVLVFMTFVLTLNLAQPQRCFSRLFTAITCK